MLRPVPFTFCHCPIGSCNTFEILHENSHIARILATLILDCATQDLVSETCEQPKGTTCQCSHSGIWDWHCDVLFFLHHKVRIFLIFQILFTQEQRLFPILDILKESYIQLSVNNLGYIRMGRGSKALRSSTPRCMINSSRSLKKIGIEPHYVGWT
jgi:hypothetical protein